MLEVTQPFTNHNGGQLAFGPDGLLYIALGDGGSGGDPFGHGQNRATLLGAILRIDVDAGSPYAIPAGNPFAGNSFGAREEIYAYGLRNPWRFSFDRRGGQTRMWVADVGQGNIEEISLVESGDNCGWNVLEGSSCFQTPNCQTAGFRLPLFEYNHASGDQSITGGYVYRGARLPALYGAYIYGDFISGRIWALHWEGVSAPVNTPLVDMANNSLTTFGIDAGGELYFCLLDGRIYHLMEER